MLLLIDGYNLLNTSDLFPRGKGGATLQAAREALLAFLAQALDPKLRGRTTIVFDAQMGPAGLPRRLARDGITVLFAPRNATADDLLEELIAGAADPRHLLVVSSDHRVQRAARQGGAKFVDSEKWYSALAAQARANDRGRMESDKPPIGLKNPFPPGYAADVAAEEWRPPRRGKGKSR